MRRALVAMAIAVCLAAEVHAQPGATASVDSNTVSIGEPFAIRVTASGSNIGEPVIPHAEGLDIERNAISTSQSFQSRFVNGRMESQQSRNWVFSAVARKEGALTVPGIQIRIENTDYVTEPISLTAVAGAPPNLTPPPGQDAGAAQLTWDDVVFIDTQVDKKSVYAGERIHLTYSIWVLDMRGLFVSPLHTGQHPAPPDTAGFYATPINFNQRRDTRNGKAYNVTEYSRDLYPTAPGDLSVGTWEFQCLADATNARGRRVREQIVRTSEPLAIEAKPLPEAPPEFSGAVGEYRMQASLSDASVQQGVPVLLTLEITGRGNPDAISPPALPPMPWAQTRDPSWETPPPAENAVEMTTRIEYEITPLEAGQFTIPPVSFVFFDPVTSQYRTAKSNEFAFSVASSGASKLVTAASNGTTPDTIQILGGELEPLIRTPKDLAPWRPNWALTGAGALLPPLAYAAALFWRRRQRRFAEDPAFARSYFARARTAKLLARVEQSNAPAEALHQAATGYLGDKLHVNAAGMTSDDARALLQTRGAPQELADAFARILRTCERARYGANGLTPEEVRALTAALEEQMDRLDLLLAGKTS